METKKDTYKMARVSVMPDLQERRRYGVPELQRNIPTNHILQNSIEHNIEPNQTIPKGKYRRILVG
jgi:hypothetical protein